MLFAIKYDTSRKGLISTNNTLKNCGSDILFSGNDTGIFFTNPIVAIKVANKLNKKNKHLTYKVYRLSKEKEKTIHKSLIVSTMEEYKKLAREQIDDAMIKLQDLQEKQEEPTA